MRFAEQEFSLSWLEVLAKNDIGLRVDLPIEEIAAALAIGVAVFCPRPSFNFCLRSVLQRDPPDSKVATVLVGVGLFKVLSNDKFAIMAIDHHYFELLSEALFFLLVRGGVDFCTGGDCKLLINLVGAEVKELNLEFGWVEEANGSVVDLEKDVDILGDLALTY